MDLKPVLQSQYLAALAMLKQAIENCPEEVWYQPDDPFRFWSKAYHALFFAHLYGQQTKQDFVPWEKHHDPDGDVPFTKAEVLEYLAFVERLIPEQVHKSDLAAASGFDWYPVNKLEMHFINLRHIQQHAGELYETLGLRAGLQKLGWIGYRHTFEEHE